MVRVRPVDRGRVRGFQAARPVASAGLARSLPERFVGKGAVARIGPPDPHCTFMLAGVYRTNAGDMTHRIEWLTAPAMEATEIVPHDAGTGSRCDTEQSG